MALQIGVVGEGACSRATARTAERVGAAIARAGAVLFCGGRTGVMEAASRGAARAGGAVVGVLPGFSRRDANRWVTIPVVTGMDQARNVVLVRSCDAVIAVGGSYGTLSEIALALKVGKRVIVVGAGNTAIDAVTQAKKLGAERSAIVYRKGPDEMPAYDYEYELGSPWNHPDAWMRISYPFLHAERIKTPTLFLCGEKDFNVPLLNTEQMYQALRTLGVPTELVIYPGQFHRLTKPSYILDRYKRYLDWYGKYLGSKP